MFLLNIKRVMRVGFINFWRNTWVSLATILVMVLALFVIGSLIFGRVLLSSSLARLEDKVDITVYFKNDTRENEIISLKESLAKLDEVRDVIYISSDKALSDFKARHADNNLIARSLEELDSNPLGASLNIKAKNPSQYESISRFLEASLISSIDKINYHQNKLVIERLSNILNASRNAGIGISIVLSVIAMLVTFNTIRLAIYTSRDEITVMRLVGATSRYIRGPFIIEGIMCGFFAAVIAMIIFYPLALWLGPAAENFFGGPNFFAYYISNFAQLFFILLGIGAFLGTFSSWIATRRYLKV